MSTPAPLDPARPHRGTLLVRDGEVVSVEHHAGEQCVMRVRCADVAARALPGHFVHLQCDPHLAMRRPMSIMRASARDGWFDMLFKVHGAGTARLAARRAGEVVSVLGPIGRPFRLRGYRRRPLLIGGGVGIPPMVFLAEHLKACGESVSPLVLMGSEVPFPFRARPSRILVEGAPAAVIAAMPLLDDWGIPSRLASLAGYPGCFEGYVTDLARTIVLAGGTPREDIEIYACGPTPMLKAVAALARDLGIPAEISLEEYMACAVGGCAGCTVRVETAQGPAMKRVCVDGPVFDAAQVVFPG